MAPQAEKEMTVTISSHTNVKPRKQIGSKELPLTTFDLPYLAFYYNQKLLLYKKEDELDFEGIVRKMKEGLEIVLDDFYPLAGKLVTDEDGVFSLQYDNDSQGVEVLEAAADGISVDDLLAKESSSSFMQLIPCNGIPNVDGLHRPLVSIQITKLTNGIALGCAFNHAVLDGSSTWHFIGSWAQICKNGKTITDVPLLDRSKFRIARVKLQPYLAALPPAKEDQGPRNRDKIFKFSDAAIGKIKKSVNECALQEGEKPYSTFQCLGVHIWRSVCRARNLKPEHISVFAVFMNCRKNHDPPIPESYFGNVIHAIFTISPVGMLGEGPPAVGASLIQKAINANNHKAIDERNREWEKNPKIFQYRDAGVNCVVVGSSPRFKVYDVDFGWGKAEIVRGGGNNKFDGMVYLYPGKSGGQSIDAEITLEEGAMERLEQDKGFLMEEKA